MKELATRVMKKVTLEIIVIVMNPPFEKGQDIDHVKRAYRMLAPGGCLVAIMSEGTFFRGDRKISDFRSWLLGEIHVEHEKVTSMHI